MRISSGGIFFLVTLVPVLRKLWKEFGGSSTPAPTSLAGIDPRFADHYAEYIRPHVDAFEAKRVTALNSMRQRLFILVPVALLVVGWAITHPGKAPTTKAVSYTVGGHTMHGTHTSSGSDDPIAALGMFVVIALGVWTAMPMFGYKKDIKTIIFPEIFRFFGPQWRYHSGQYHPVPHVGLGFSASIATALQQVGGQTTNDWQRFEAFDVLPSHTSSRVLDRVEGSHNAVPIDLWQVHLSRETSGKNRRSHTVFSGLLVMLDVPKNFTGHTVVRRDMGRLGNALHSLSMPRVHLEDPRFEARYEVFGTDQIQARYLLTTSFMERVMALEDLMASHSILGRCAIQCAFLDGKMLLTLPTDAEWFKAGSIFKPVTFVDDINLILQQMDQLFAMVTVLKLDEHTGL